MKLSKLSVFVVVLLLFAVSTFVSCSQRSDRHWGQKLDIDKSWWKMEGQSWDRDKNVFMAVGHSNPNWTDKYDMRKSADLDARAQVAQFMASLVKTYSEEVRSHNFSIGENVIEASAEETVLGSVIVARKHKSKRYMSLVKVDLGYFFSNVYKAYRNDASRHIERQNKNLSREKLDKLISEKVNEALSNLKKLEGPSVEMALEQNTQSGEQ
jgi:hypothetical protein